ncbi:cation:proton antiporter [Gynuella sunshinyii]|uniref:NhaP-type Na+/H+ and K+/H+ antiporter n=1 Tax=Gynuella sunshinyii YC6258 TaxID=1445510 RepID=A0A0C5VDB3_9GAMM|nr:sodium:proton antiporter [Gynuella sunshinyii]AJQ92532.1 nhaP-type Na+/H+ and K+/H+ antiporter [Gynuella sunshinyii YC6258]
MIESLNPSFLLALLMLAGFFCQWLGWRSGLPAILFLLLTGMVLGPLTGWVNPDELLGELLFPFVSLGVAVILFEGSLTLKFHEISGLKNVIRNMTTIGVLLTWGLMTAITCWLAQVPLAVAALFGALMTVTGPTVVVPMLRSINAKANIANILRWEGIVVDPIGALLAVLVFEAIVTGDQAHSLIAFARLVGAGIMLGLVGALIMRQALLKQWIPNYLVNFFSLAVLLVVFTLANHFEDEAGLVAVTLMGIVLANLKGVHMESILDFKEHLSVLLISMMFILLAARMDFQAIAGLGFAAILILLSAQLLVRPLAVWVSTLGSDLRWTERAMLAWIAPRGIVAAAIASLFALKLAEAGIEGAEALLPLTFVMIVGTVLIQSFSAGWLAKKLDVSLANAQGVLIHGANKISLALATSLQKQGFDVIVADQDRRHINEARMLGLRTYFGNVLSEHADIHLDLMGMKKLLLMSRREDGNHLIFNQYKHDFPENGIYALNTAAPSNNEKAQVRKHLRARVLFAETCTWSKLSSLFSQGAEIRVTTITDEFTFARYREHWNDRFIPLYAISPDKKLKIMAADSEFDIKSGWQIASLVSTDM